MIINGINDKKCSEKLMEFPADQLTLDKVISTCRQVELTSAHLKSLGAVCADVNVARNQGNGNNNNRQRFSGNHETPPCRKYCRRHAPRNCPSLQQTVQWMWSPWTFEGINRMQV